jgi:hypothetical protein
MSVVRALTAAAHAVAHGDYPYVYGGGHAEAGTASVGIKAAVNYTRGRRGTLTAAEITFADARTVTATITALAPDRSSVTVQSSGGGSLTLAAADPRLLDWVSVGETVAVTYTPGAADTPVAHARQPVQ